MRSENLHERRRLDLHLVRLKKRNETIHPGSQNGHITAEGTVNNDVLKGRRRHREETTLDAMRRREIRTLKKLKERWKRNNQ